MKQGRPATESGPQKSFTSGPQVQKLSPKTKDEQNGTKGRVNAPDVAMGASATNSHDILIVGGGTNAETQPTCAGIQLGIGLVPGTAY